MRGTSCGVDIALLDGWTCCSWLLTIETTRCRTAACDAQPIARLPVLDARLDQTPLSVIRVGLEHRVRWGQLHGVVDAKAFLGFRVAQALRVGPVESSLVIRLF